MTERPKRDSCALTAGPARPDAERGQRGRFAAGNTIGGNAVARAAEKRLREASDAEETLAIAKQAAKTTRALIADRPKSTAAERELLALAGRALAWAAHYSRRADRAGVSTAEGEGLLDKASAHSQKAERFLLSAQEVSKATRGAGRNSPASFIPGLVQLPSRSTARQNAAPAPEDSEGPELDGAEEPDQ